MYFFITILMTYPVIVSVLQMKKPRPKAIRWLAQGRMADLGWYLSNLESLMLNLTLIHE